MKDASLYRTKYLKIFFYNISSMCYLKRSIRYKTREILGCDFLDLCVLTGGVYRTLSFRTDIVLRSMPQMFCC